MESDDGVAIPIPHGFSLFLIVSGKKKEKKETFRLLFFFNIKKNTQNTLIHSFIFYFEEHKEYKRN